MPWRERCGSTRRRQAHGRSPPPPVSLTYRVDLGLGGIACGVK